MSAHISEHLLTPVCCNGLDTYNLIESKGLNISWHLEYDVHYRELRRQTLNHNL